MILHRRRELLLCASVLSMGLDATASANAQTATSTHHRASSHRTSSHAKTAAKTTAATQAPVGTTASVAS
ncbi:hypothetical protein AD936_04580, partial [Gluconobacter japonicus]